MISGKLQVFLLTAVSLPAVCMPALAQGNNPSWQEQQIRNREMTRQALQQQAQQGPSPQVQQAERWEREWKEQHPNEPVPNFGVLSKMHRGELLNNMNTGFARMRQNRQAELQRNYGLVRQMQQQKNTAAGVTWSNAQWQQWDKTYDNDQRQAANNYLEGIRREGERQREEWRRTGVNPFATP